MFTILIMELSRISFSVIWNMKFDVGRAVFVSFVILILLLNITVTVAEELEFQVESTNLQIYRDGLVRVTQTLLVNETFPVVTLPLLASSVDNIIMVDENQTVLDYEIEGTNLYFHFWSYKRFASI
jgi:hypothetical protein